MLETKAPTAAEVRTVGQVFTGRILDNGHAAQVKLRRTAGFPWLPRLKKQLVQPQLLGQ